MAQPPANAQYRPYRLAVWLVYFVVLGIFGTSILLGVMRSVWAMSPEHLPAAAQLGATECQEKARALWVELDERRKAMSAAPEVHLVDADYWTAFRTGWLERHRAAEAACSAQAPIFKRLDQVMDLYTTHAVQFAGEVGPTVDKLKAELDAKP